MQINRGLSLIFLFTLFVIVGCNDLNESLYHVKDSGLVVDASLSIGSHNFYWLDNHRIITQTRGKIVTEPTIKNQLEKVSLVIWITESNNIETIVPPATVDFSSLCVADNFFKFGTGIWGGISENLSYVGDLDQNKNIKNLKPNMLVGEIDAISCKLKSDVVLPEWAKKIDPINIRLLRPEHGFIVIYRNDILQWPTSVKLYRPGASENEGFDFSKELNKPTDAFVFGLIPLFYSYKNAYYLGAISGPETPVWWLNIDGTLQQDNEMHQLKNMKVSSSTSTGWLYPTNKLSPIASVSSFRVGKINDDGLYTFNQVSSPKRLVKGRVDNNSINVSPDGCSVAFLNDDRKYIDARHPMLFHKLQVINLCL